MLADGSAHWTRALGLELDLDARGMGVRSQRYSALLQDGVVKQLNIEAPGKFETSRSEEHTSELQSLMRISYAVFCLKKNTTTRPTEQTCWAYSNQTHT